MPVIKIINTGTQTTGEMTGTTYGAAISLDGAKTFSVQCNVTVDTPGNKTFASTDVSTVNDTATITGHGFSTGDKFQLTTSGALPTGLSTSTDYFAIVVDANTIGFASSLANALIGTKIDLTGVGSGTNTVVITALAGATVKLQKSNDGTNWSDEGSATTISATSLNWLEKADPTGLWMRVAFTLTAGQMTSSNVFVVKGPN